MCLAGLCLTVVLAGCSLHVSKNGISGNILGHSFAGARGSLPAGFPGDVPTPDDSRVLGGGGGADHTWDVAFAVTGALDTGTMAYESKLHGAGYAVGNYQSGTTPIPASTGTGSTSTTITVSGSTFEATNQHWRVQVASGSAGSVKGTRLHPGEFGLDIIVLPVTTPTTTSAS
jgi:hypothetical protein